MTFRASFRHRLDDRRQRQRRRPAISSTGIDRDIDRAAQLAVHLHAERHPSSAVNQAGSATGQGSSASKPIVAETLPQLFGEMRHHRADQLDHDVSMPGPPHPLPPPRLRRVSSTSALVSSRMRATARLKPNFSRSSVTRPIVRCIARRRSPRRCLPGPPAQGSRRRSAGLLGRRLDHPPQPVDEAPGALDAGVGPLQVALRRAVGKHEQPRRVGAVGVDDAFRIDDVLLRLRHFLRAAD